MRRTSMKPLMVTILVLLTVISGVIVGYYVLEYTEEVLRFIRSNTPYVDSHFPFLQ